MSKKKIWVIQVDHEVSGEEICEMENTKRLKDTIVAVGDVVNYPTYPSNTCFCVKLHLQEDEKCKPSHQMQDKEASAVGTMIKLRQENEKYVFTKALTRM